MPNESGPPVLRLVRAVARRRRPAAKAPFSYSTGVHHPVERAVCRLLEKTSGMRELSARCESARALLEDQDVWSAALEALEVDAAIHGAGIEAIPASGPLVVVANHPFGLLDGVVLCHLVSQVRTDFKVLVHAAVEQVPEVAPFALPVDFRNDAAALRRNMHTRREARALLERGGTVIVFPAGGVSTAPWRSGRAVDAEWKTFTAKLVGAAGATVLPVFFPGENSRLFQLVSRLNINVRAGLLPRETCRRIGQTLDVVIGEPLSRDDITAVAGGRRDLMLALREVTYSLAGRLSEAS